MGERGKVVWIIAGAERDSVRLAVELLRAIRARRLDIRLVLTFEHDYPELLALLDDCDKTGWGYAPCDHPKAIARVMARFEPFGVILVGTRPRPNLLAALVGHAHMLAVNVPDPVDFDCERIYAADESADCAAQSGTGGGYACDTDPGAGRSQFQIAGQWQCGTAFVVVAWCSPESYAGAIWRTHLP